MGIGSGNNRCSSNGVSVGNVVVNLYGSSGEMCWCW